MKNCLKIRIVNNALFQWLAAVPIAIAALVPLDKAKASMIGGRLWIKSIIGGRTLCRIAI